MPGNSKKGGKSLEQLHKQVKGLGRKVGSGKRGGGSDYLMVHNSRGPVNTPDIGWSNGLPTYRQFTKTGQYIPNSKLSAAAAPISAGIAKDMSVPPSGHAYDPYASTLGSLIGGKRKKKTTTKKRKVVRRKKTTTKKKKTTKKKTTTKPKRKTSTKKRKVVKRKTSKKKRTTKPKRKTSTKKSTTTRRKKRTTKKKSLLNRVRSALSF